MSEQLSEYLLTQPSVPVRIEILTEKKLIGKRLTMSLTKNKTFELWNGFMPRRKDIPNIRTSDLFSVTIYKPSYFIDFSPASEFEKWAAVEVTDFANKPSDLEELILRGGQYAVFSYKGSSNDARIFDYIFQFWLPDSDFVLDHRPHFEVLGKKYKNNSVDSEEEIWIPVILK